MKRAWAGGAVLAGAMAATFVATAWFFTQDAEPEGAERGRIASAVLGEDRDVIVRLPQGYAERPETRFPVIYVLDGSSQDAHTAASAALLARLDIAPELIVVGIPNGGNDRRERDYTPPFMSTAVDDPAGPKGAGDRFLRFLRTELIPDIDRRYRTTGARMLMGHSRGGLLAAYSLIAEPGLFEARFVHSAPVWRYDGVLVAALGEYFASAPTVDSFLYVSVGANETAQMIGGFERLRELLGASAPGSLRWVAERTPGAVHNTNAEWAMPRGLQAFYRPR